MFPATAGGPVLDQRRLAPARWVPARSRAGVRWGTAYPLGGRGSYGASGPSDIGRWVRWDLRRLEPARWFPARSRAGIQAFSRESPDAKSRGGAPAPPGLGPARSHSLILAWWGATGRCCVYFAAHVRALIWGAISCRAVQPRGFPLGGKSLGVGASLSDYNTRLPQPAQLGGGPLRASVHGPQARQKKREAPAGSPQPEKVGPGRKNLFLPGALSSGFLRRKPGPRPGPGGPPGRCAPRPRKSLDHPKGT